MHITIAELVRSIRLWLPSGGHVEPSEHPEATVHRELFEELSINAEVQSPKPFFLTVTRTVGPSSHTDVSLWYLLEGSRAMKLEFDPLEFYGVKWFELNTLPLERTDPHLERFARKLEQNRPDYLV